MANRPVKPGVPNDETMEPIQQTVRKSIWERDAYMFLFGLLLVDYFVLSFVSPGRWAALLRVVPVSVTVLFALYTSGASSKLVRAAEIVVAAGLVSGVIALFVQREASGDLAFVFLTILLVITPVQIVRRLMTHERVDVQTVFAALDVYIIIGLIFAYLLIILGAATWFFTETRFITQASGRGATNQYVYLSFETLTTVGLGDITPHTELARSVVILEALIGQIFLVTLVARLVSMYGAEVPMMRRVRERREGIHAGERDEGEVRGPPPPDMDISPWPPPASRRQPPTTES